MTTIKAIPLFAGMLLKNSSNASKPPADAPSPTTGNLGLPISLDLLPAFFLGFAFLLVAVFFAEVRLFFAEVRLLDSVFDFELLFRELPAVFFLRGDDFFLAKCEPFIFVHHAGTPGTSD